MFDFIFSYYDIYLLQVVQLYFMTLCKMVSTSLSANLAEVVTSTPSFGFAGRRQASQLNLTDVFLEQTNDIDPTLRQTPIRTYDQRQSLAPCKYHCGGCRLCSLHRITALPDTQSARSHLLHIRERNRVFLNMDTRFTASLVALGRQSLEISPKRSHVHGCYLGSLYGAHSHNKVLSFRLNKHLRNKTFVGLPRKLTR